MHDEAPRTIRMVGIHTIMPDGMLQSISDDAAQRILESTNCPLQDNCTKEKAIQIIQMVSAALLHFSYGTGSGHKTFEQAWEKLGALRDTLQQLFGTTTEPPGKVAQALRDLDEWFIGESANVQRRKGHKSSTYRRKANKRIIDLFRSLYGADRVVETTESVRSRSGTTAQFIIAFRAEMQTHFQILIDRSDPKHIDALNELKNCWRPLSSDQLRYVIRSAKGKS